MKRTLCFALLLILLAGLIALPSAAAEIVYFTAINNTLLNLKEETMPVKVKSIIYIPYSVFSTNALGTYSLYSRNTQTVLVSNGDKVLSFDMSTGDSYDDSGETYRYAATYINETAYLPAYFVANFFGIRYSYIRSDYGHVIRLTNGDVFSDEDFVSGAANMMETRLNQYLRTQGLLPPSATPVLTPSPTATLRPVVTSQPVVTPVPIQDRSHVSVYLAFLGIGEQTGDTLTALETAGYSACFFATEEQILAEPDLVRRILGSGFSLGVLFYHRLPGEYQAASQALEAAAMTVTFLAAAEDALDAETLQEARDTGLVLWSAEAGMNSFGICEAFLLTASRRCDLLLTEDFTETKSLVGYLQRYHYKVEAISELTETRLQYADTH